MTLKSLSSTSTDFSRPSGPNAFSSKACDDDDNDADDNDEEYLSFAIECKAAAKSPYSSLRIHKDATKILTFKNLLMNNGVETSIHRNYTVVGIQADNS